MTLVELYANTPTTEHGKILVEGGKVYVLGADGTDEYVLRAGGQLVLVRSEAASEGRILARLTQSLDGRMGDISAIRKKLGA